MHTLWKSLLALALVTLPALAAEDDAIVGEFKKYFKKYKDTPTRVEAVLSLEGSESAAAVEALVDVLPAAEPDVVEAAVRVLAGFQSPEPGAAVVAALAQSSSEKVRETLLRAVAGGRYALSEELLAELFADRAWTVRRRALEAAGRPLPGRPRPWRASPRIPSPPCVPRPSTGSPISVRRRASRWRSPRSRTRSGRCARARSGRSAACAAAIRSAR